MSTTAANNVSLLREYVSIQTMLLFELNSTITEEIDEFNFKDLIPDTISAKGKIWNLMPHGLGIKFTNQTSGEIVDAHKGFLDSPRSIDPWRLATFCLSRNRQEDESFWKAELKKLEKVGLIETESRYLNHYVFK